MDTQEDLGIDSLRLESTYLNDFLTNTEFEIAGGTFDQPTQAFHDDLAYLRATFSPSEALVTGNWTGFLASTATLPSVFDMHSQGIGQPSTSTVVDVTGEDDVMTDWSHPMTSCTFPSTIAEVCNGSTQINNSDTRAVAGTNGLFEQHEYANKKKSADTTYACLDCGVSSTYYPALKRHAIMTRHRAMACDVNGCTFRYSCRSEKFGHLREAHTDLIECDECGFTGASQFELEIHAYQIGHAAFVCSAEDCEKRFSRIDTFKRHLRTHSDNAKRHSCRYCKKYRGANGFKRKDHLVQHIRNYHHINVEHASTRGQYQEFLCTHDVCGSFNEQGSVTAWRTKSSTEFTKHMRTVHDESPFPCPMAICDRVKGKGYFRKADLRAHLRKVHGTDGRLEGDGH